MERRKLLSFKADTPAGLYALGAHRYEIRERDGDVTEFNTTEGSIAAEQVKLLKHIEEALANNRATPEWDKERVEIARFLRGAPIASTTDHVVSVGGPTHLYITAGEPFAQAPDPDELLKLVLANTFYRRVLYTPAARGFQQVAMCVHHLIPPEIHPDVDQYFLVERGEGVCIVNGKTTKLRPKASFWVERGSLHEVHADRKHGPLLLSVAYTPAHHPAGRIDVLNNDVIEWIEK